MRVTSVGIGHISCLSDRAEVVLILLLLGLEELVNGDEGDVGGSKSTCACGVIQGWNFLNGRHGDLEQYNLRQGRVAVLEDIWFLALVSEDDLDGASVV